MRKYNNNWGARFVRYSPSTHIFSVILHFIYSIWKNWRANDLNRIADSCAFSSMPILLRPSRIIEVEPFCDPYCKYCWTDWMQIQINKNEKKKTRKTKVRNRSEIKWTIAQNVQKRTIQFATIYSLLMIKTIIG